jgi:hypothetical protein
MTEAGVCQAEPKVPERGPKVLGSDLCQRRSANPWGRPHGRVLGLARDGYKRRSSELAVVDQGGRTHPEAGVNN